MQYVEATAPSDMNEEHSDSICVRWSTSYEVNHNVCRKELKGGVVII